MFQRFVAILLIIAVISSNFTKCVIFASFKINQKYIAENLCVNRDKPWMHCNGQCYLMKKLKQAEEKEQKQSRQDQKNLVQDAFLTSAGIILFDTKLLAVLSLPPLQNYFYRDSLSVFHPPQKISLTS